MNFFNLGHKVVLRFDEWLDRCDRAISVRSIQIFGALLILIFFGLTGYLLDTAKFSPDSWSYYELAKTIFDEKFYIFNTWRSYFAEHYSAAFPLGYPVAVALVQKVIGTTPFAAVLLNIVLAALTWVIGIRLAIRIGASPFSALVLNTALVLSTPYLDEVFSGRSIPLAIIWDLLAFTAYQKKRPFVGGALLGFAAITRFDMLVVSLLSIVGVALLDKGARRDLGWWITGLLIGISPWVGYSLIHFGRFWVADNSWVALSALPAYVLDFPARSGTTLFDSPVLWLERIVSNLPGLIRGVGGAAIRFPPLIALLVLSVWAVPGIEKVRLRRMGLALLVMATSLAPYLLTGYFDVRYFSLLMIASSLVLVLLLTPTARSLMHALLAVALGLSVALGGIYLIKGCWHGYDMIQNNGYSQMNENLNDLYKCHFTQPERTLLFHNSFISSFQYGAITGMKTATFPSNFYRMSEAEKNIYYEYMEPFLIIDESFSLKRCAANDKK